MTKQNGVPQDIAEAWQDLSQAMDRLDAALEKMAALDAEDERRAAVAISTPRLVPRKGDADGGR